MKTKSTLLLTLLSAAAATLIPASGSHAQTLGTPTVLHSFTSASDGADSVASLLLASDGNFYGTANQGGANTNGTLYRITAAGEFSVIHSFSLATEGGYPQGPLIQGTDGFLYGGTITGGPNSGGTIYKVALDGTGFTVLHGFNSSFSSAGGEGYYPLGGVIEVGGAFYGTCFYSGGINEYGAVFKMLADGTTIPVHAFTGGADGGNPTASLLLASDGNIYGSTTTGGFSTAATGGIFKVNPATDTESVVTTFLDANAPSRVYGPLLEVASGDARLLYGTSSDGGSNGDGTIFSVTFGGTLAILHNFDHAVTGGAPHGGLILSANGQSLFGTTTSSTVASGMTYGGFYSYNLSSATVTPLHFFTQDEGINSFGTLIRGTDGRYYGAAATGGGNGTGGGTIFAVSLDPTPGAVAFATSAFNTTDNAGSVTLTLQRTGGSDGDLSVVVATADGTAVAGTDYQSVSKTVEWADGDTADKTVTVPIIDRDLNDGTTRNFTATINGDSNQSTLVTATVVITESSAVVQPTVEITSPPADLTVVSGTKVTFAVSVADPNSILKKVDFFVNNTLFATTTGKGPFAVTETAPPFAGTYTIKAVATDNQGRTSTSTRKIVIVTPNASDPTPTANIFSGLAGRILAGGDTISIVAEAKSLSPDGTPLASVAFYADNTLIAKFDGRGNLITRGAGAAPGWHTSAATPGVTPSSTGSLFSASWGIPNLSKLVNLITVATSAGGRSQISAPITVNTMSTSATSNHAPRTKLANLTAGQKIKVGSELSIVATATDPDGGSNAILATATGRHTKAVLSGSLVKQMDFYLNQVKVATSTTAPYTATITPPAAGSYVVQAIAVDDAGLSGPATPVTIQATSTATVNLALPGIDGNKVGRLEGSGTLKVKVVRSGDTSEPLTVTYKAKGPNVQGTDINQLKGTLTIPAGAMSGKIKVRFLDDGVLDGNKTLKLRLTPSTDGSYEIGTPAQVKIQVIDLQGVE